MSHATLKPLTLKNGLHPSPRTPLFCISTAVFMTYRVVGSRFWSYRWFSITIADSERTIACVVCLLTCAQALQAGMMFMCRCSATVAA